LDDCGFCDVNAINDNTTCEKDCADVWGGDSVLTGCDNICNSTKEFDECGICVGDNTVCTGCDGVPNSGLVFDCAVECGGDAELDMCNICDSDSGNDCTQDCSSEWGGDLVFDCTGVCGGGTLISDWECCGLDAPYYSGYYSTIYTTNVDDFLLLLEQWDSIMMCNQMKEGFFPDENEYNWDSLPSLLFIDSSEIISDCNETLQNDIFLKLEICYDLINGN